jgi:hypothetical protein
MEIFTLILAPQMAVDLVNILGQMPTQSNVHPLFLELKKQVEDQIAKANEPKVENPAQ